ncbi:MAG: hypothetical protein R3293_23390 [Candidatus Promineifilaceae bacterium]|nr:hypothetical protein [Candidatus Promineifilaceae bacterium]
MKDKQQQSDSADEFSIEQNAHAFVIRIWLEEMSDEEVSGLWRGYIMHAYSGEKRYLQKVSQIVNFIKPYLAEWDVLEEQ